MNYMKKRLICKIALKDSENLMTLWVDFFDTPDFAVLDTKEIREFKKFLGINSTFSN